MSWPGESTPDDGRRSKQRSRAWKQLLLSPPAAVGKVNGIISHIHVTRPNEPCQMCWDTCWGERRGMGGGWSASALGSTVVCLSLVCNNTSNLQPECGMRCMAYATEGWPADTLLKFSIIPYRCLWNSSSASCHRTGHKCVANNEY